MLLNLQLGDKSLIVIINVISCACSQSDSTGSTISYSILMSLLMYIVLYTIQTFIITIMMCHHQYK